MSLRVSAVDAACGLLDHGVMFGLIRKLFWFGFFVIATLGFIVLFEHGTADFGKNLKVETQNFIQMVQMKPKKADDKSDDPAR